MSSECLETRFGVQTGALLHDELLDRSGQDELVFREPFSVGVLRSGTFAREGLGVIRFGLGSLRDPQDVNGTARYIWAVLKLALGMVADVDYVYVKLEYVSVSREAST